MSCKMIDGLIDLNPSYTYNLHSYSSDNQPPTIIDYDDLIQKIEALNRTRVVTEHGITYLVDV